MRLEDLEVSAIEDKPSKGMWHCGPNMCWITATHIPTMQSVRVYGDQMHRTREKALSALELLVDGWGGENCMFPENLSPNTEESKE